VFQPPSTAIYPQATAGSGSRRRGRLDSAVQQDLVFSSGFDVFMGAQQVQSSNHFSPLNCQAMAFAVAVGWIPLGNRTWRV